MKNRLSKLLVMAVLLAVLYVPQVAFADVGGLRYTISVVKFENRAGWSGQYDIGDAWGLVMTDILQQTGKFIVLGETDMRQEAMKEQDLAASGRTVQGPITPGVGNMTPAQILVKGAITHVEANKSGGGGFVGIGGVGVGGGGSTSEINVTMYMVDSSTGQIMASKSVIGKSNAAGGFIGYSGGGWYGGAGGFQKDNTGKAIENAVQQGVQWMIAQLPKVPWTGSVALVQGGQVYINRGSREGVQTGQQFSVGKADVIRDPATGEILDTSMSSIARIECNNVREKISICNVINGNSDSISKGMTVMP